MSTQYDDFNKKYGDIIFIGSYIISGVSLLCLSLVLFKISKHKIKKSIMTTSLFIITISEIINCISKLLNILRQLIKPKNEQDYSYWLIGQVQILFSLFSDSCTIISSFILTLKIYKTTLRHGLNFFNSKNIFIKILLFSLLTPLFFSLTILFLNIYLYGGTAEESESEYKIWAWINCRLSLLVYSIVWIFIISIMILIGKTISYLNKRKKELLQEEEDDDDEDNVTKESSESSILSEKINETVNKLYYFPIVTCVIWILLSIDRIPDDIINLGMKGKKYVYQGNWLYVKYATIFLHNVIGSARGIIYCVTFFRVDSKLFNEIKNVLSCAWLCKKKERYSTTINSDLPNEPVTFES